MRLRLCLTIKFDIEVLNSILKSVVSVGLYPGDDWLWDYLIYSLILVWYAVSIEAW